MTFPNEETSLVQFTGSSSFGFLFEGCSLLFLVVVFDIERTEHVCEETSIEGQEGSNWFGIGTARLELNLQCVHEDDQELNLSMREGNACVPCIAIGKLYFVGSTYDLQDSDVLLPPQVFLYFRSHGGQQVVGIHNDVDEGVDESEQGSVTT